VASRGRISRRWLKRCHRQFRASLFAACPDLEPSSL
jgi:hypothetical protein